MSVYIIGAGGGGSWLVPAMAMLVGKKHIIVVDGDTLEERNLDRQLFTEKDIGRNKAEALAERYGVESIGSWYSRSMCRHTSFDWIFGCVDNNQARCAILETCDEELCKAIIAGNEVTSAEAYYYDSAWRGTPLDPRVYYPQLLQDDGEDPSSPCTGEAQKAKPQLVSANIMAISLAQWLYVFWAMQRPKLPKEVNESNFPYLLRSNMTLLETMRIGDKRKE